MGKDLLKYDELNKNYLNEYSKLDRNFLNNDYLIIFMYYIEMNEYYKFRYNLYKFFLNIDNNDYNNLISIIIPLLYIIPILFSVLAYIYDYYPYLIFVNYND